MLNRLRAWYGETILCCLWILKTTLLNLPLLRRFYIQLLIHLIKRSRLFDRSHYLADNPDVASSQISPLRHYVRWGDSEGRNPMPLFDPVYYRHHSKMRLSRINALLHYCYVGRYRGISPSPWFDVKYYLSTNKDVARAGVDPLLHFVTWGGIEGRSPCVQFDSAFYLRENPTLIDARSNPLLHYLTIGRYEGRTPLPVDAADEKEPANQITPRLPTNDDWRKVTARSHNPLAVVDIVVPVYKGRVETLRCLYSVLAAGDDTPYELVVLNDSSPDPELVSDLQRLAGEGLFTLITNSKNKGFVHTVNRGIELHPERDVLLLNSDTEVYGNWIDRLRTAALRHSRTGTVTPLSNNATICSYPRALYDNPYPLEISYAEFDELTARINAGVEVESPTAVGFCTYIRRQCLTEVGLFDEKHFGKGYGEENDFSQRAIRKGWRNIIVADVFVHHWGSTSFQGERARRVDLALKTLNRLHPDYQKDVADFIQQDPLAGTRQRLDLERLKLQVKEKNVLIVCHNRGGGTERHIHEDIERFTALGFGTFFLRPKAGQPAQVLVRHPRVKLIPNLPSFELKTGEALQNVLRDLKIAEIHTHSMVDFEPDAPGQIVDLAQALGARLEVNLHDYKVICPRINLVNDDGLYCGEPSEKSCYRCLTEYGSDFRVTDISAWRRVHLQALLAADRVLVPDQDVVDRLSRYFPGVNFAVSPHEEHEPTRLRTRWPQLKPGEKLRVVVIGAIGKIKGFNVLLACARHARHWNLPLEFIVLGYSLNDSLLEAEDVHITGKYHENNALQTLMSLNPHIIWLPSLWPETYSYTLSLALQTELPIAAFDIGAISSRLRRQNLGDLLLPLDKAGNAMEINHVFLTALADHRQSPAESAQAALDH